MADWSGVLPDKKEFTIEMNIDVEEVLLNIETAIPCGLLIDEMVSNSLKYAFPYGSKGNINIDLHSNENYNFILVVSDNGIGIPADVELEKADTFGMQLIKYLTNTN